MAEIQSLSLPPEGEFQTFEALLTACQEHAKAAGYAFVKANSEKRSGRYIKTINCKRAGNMCSKVPEDVRKRHRNSVKTGRFFNIEINLNTN